MRIHRDEQEVEISPFKSRAKLLVCEENGEPIVSEQVNKRVLGMMKGNIEEFLKHWHLYPKCRRSRTAVRLSEITCFEKE